MQAGKIGIVTDGALNDMGALDMKSTSDALIQGEEHELVKMASINQSIQADLGASGTNAVEGRAIWDEVAEKEGAFDDGSSVVIGEREVKDRKYTEFAGIPTPDHNDHDGFMLASSSAGSFVFDLASHSQVNCTIESAKLDLHAFLNDNRDRLMVYETGWSDPLEEDTGRSGVKWADDKMTDKEVNDALEKSSVTTLDVDYMDELRRVSLAESGWVEVYSPEMETTEYIRYLIDEILPYASPPDADDL